MSTIKVGEILVRQGLLKPDQLSKAIEEQKRSGGKLTQSILMLGFLSEEQVLRALEKHYGVPGMDVGNFEIDINVLNLITKEVAEKYTLIPIQKTGETLVIAFSDPGNIMVREDLRFMTRHKIQAVVATESAIMTAIEKRYVEAQNAKQMIIDLDTETAEEVNIVTFQTSLIDGGTSDEAPVIKFVNSVLNEAIRRKCSDIHFEPFEKKFRVRFRIDGNLIEATSPPTQLGPAISSRLKIMSKLDISERRRPQDGRMKVRTTKGKEMDFRVSSLPTMWGEKVVLRLLDKSNLQLDMAKLGFEEEDLKLFKQNIHMPQGMVLITGPTGSGKTTTIYSALQELNQSDVNIATAEDPIEFNLEGINQVQMNSDIDLTFAVALRAFLRQDPDIIMVGEIRDLETAEVSIKAASTGHLVVSTLHTNDAPSTVMRLVDMGIAPYIVTSTVNLIVAQRLVGRVCESCKQPIEVPAQTLINLGVPQAEIPEYHLMKGKGCSVCYGTGIKGRLAVYELLLMTEKIKEAILKGATSGQLRYLAREMGMRTLRRSALFKLKKGQTTIEEVLNASVKDT